MVCIVSVTQCTHSLYCTLYRTGRACTVRGHFLGKDRTLKHEDDAWLLRGGLECEIIGL